MTKANIMRSAWRVAREGQEKFGGKVSEYLSEAMKIAWQDYKIYVEYEAKEKERTNIATIDQNLKIDELLKYFAPLSHNKKFDIDGFKSIVIVWAEKKGNVTKQEASKMISDLINFKNDMAA